MPSHGTIIIGAGQGGYQVAASLREQGYEGPVTIVGDEPVAPYQRPPLSKAYLLGEMTADRLMLRPRLLLRDPQHRPAARRPRQPDRPVGRAHPSHLRLGALL